MAGVEPTETNYHQVKRGFNHLTTTACKNYSIFSIFTFIFYSYEIIAVLDESNCNSHLKQAFFMWTKLKIN